MPKKQPNKAGMTPQYSYGLSSLYLLPFFQPHTHIPIPGTPHQPIQCGNCRTSQFNATHMTTLTLQLILHSNTHSRLHTHTTYPTSYTTIHLFYNDTYTLPPVTTPFDLADGIIFSTEHISNNITALYQITSKKNLAM